VFKTKNGKLCIVMDFADGKLLESFQWVKVSFHYTKREWIEFTDKLRIIGGDLQNKVKE
jgi:hypothetical protein